MKLAKFRGGMCAYLRDISSNKLRGASVALHIVIACIIWECQLGPAVRELRSARIEFEAHLVSRGASEKLRIHLDAVQTEVRMLRNKAVETFATRERSSDANGCLRYLDAIAVSAGVKIRSFDKESRGFTQEVAPGFYKFEIEGSFPNILRFGEALSDAPTSLRLDSFEAGRTEESPETISLLLTLSDVVRGTGEPSICDANF